MKELNKRHKAVLGSFIAVAGLALATGASLAVGLGLILFGASLAWLIGSDFVLSIATKVWRTGHRFVHVLHEHRLVSGIGIVLVLAGVAMIAVLGGSAKRSSPSSTENGSNENFVIHGPAPSYLTDVNPTNNQDRPNLSNHPKPTRYLVADATVIDSGSLRKACAFAAEGSEQFCPMFDVIAQLEAGDRVTVMSPVTRSSSGVDVYEVKTRQGWVGWMEADLVKTDAEGAKEKAELEAAAEQKAAKEQLERNINDCATEKMKTWCKSHQDATGCFANGEFSTMPEENAGAWSDVKKQCTKELSVHPVTSVSPTPPR